MQLPNVPDDHFEAAMQQVTFVTAERGDVLLRSGFVEDRSVTVQSGSIAIRGADGVEFAEGTVGAVAGVGQVAWGALRMPHTVAMREAGDVMVLSRETLARLHEQDNHYAHAWECYALDRATHHYRGVARTLRRIVTDQATPQQAPTRGSLVDEIVQHTGLARLFDRRLDVAGALAQSRLFDPVAPQAFDELVGSFQLCFFERGGVLGKQFESGDVLHLLVEGDVELACAGGPGEPETVFAHAGPDALVGFAGVHGSVRQATLVATSHTVALAMPAERARELAGRYDAVGRAFRVALLRATSDASARTELQVRASLAGREGARRKEAAAFLRVVVDQDSDTYGYTTSAG